MGKQWGGKRPNQTGRPPEPEKKIRIGTLFLRPKDIERLAEKAKDGETLIAAARRLLITTLQTKEAE